MNDHHCGETLQEEPIKKDMTLDLLTVMSDRVMVRFEVVASEESIPEYGRW